MDIIRFAIGPRRLFVLLFTVSMTVPAGCHEPWNLWPLSKQASPIQAAEPAPPANTAEAIPVESEPTTRDPDLNNDVSGFLDRLAQYSTDKNTPSGLEKPVLKNRDLAHAPQQVAATPRHAANGPIELEDTPESYSESTDAKHSTASPRPAPEIISVAVISDSDLDQTTPVDVTRTTNAALSTKNASGDMAVERYLEWLRSKVERSPQDWDARWRLAMQERALGHSEVKPAAVESLPVESRRLMDASLAVVDKLRIATEDPGRGSNEALEAVESLRQDLSKQADLKVPTVKLCSRVTAFGVYETLPEDALAANRANRAIVYTEIENFSSEPAEGDQWRTRLSSRMELLSADGKTVWQHEEPAIEDLSHRRRTDFFLAQLVTFPAAIGPGQYMLKVSVQDALADKVNEGSLAVTIGDRTALTNR